MFKSFKKYFSFITGIVFVHIICFAVLNPALAKDKSIYKQTHYVELFSDGYAIHTSESTYVNTSKEPVKTHSFINSQDTIDKVLDEKGNELPLEVSHKESYYQYTAKLIKPAQPGEEYILKYAGKKIKKAQKQGDKWIYDRSHMPIPETDYTETVKLPSGAKLISVKPKPTKKFEENGSLVLVFKKHLQENEAFKCRIEYK